MSFSSSDSSLIFVVSMTGDSTALYFDTSVKYTLHLSSELEKPAEKLSRGTWIS